MNGAANIVQLPSARRALQVPQRQASRTQPMPPVPFGSWIAARDQAAAVLLGGANRLLLTGPAGTGKTVLIEHVARVLRAAGRNVVIQLADADPAPPGPEMTLFVDEADRLSLPKLKQLFGESLGTVVLTGLAPLTRRVPAGTVQLTLGPLGQEEARGYIAQWLALTGRTPAELDSKAVRSLVELSGGVPRLLSTLLAAGVWLAESNGARVIEALHIQEAADLRSVLTPVTHPDPAPLGALPGRGNRLLWSGALAGCLLAGIAALIAPRLFPSEAGQAIEHATLAAQQAERWLRSEPNPPAPRPAKTAVVTTAVPQAVEPPAPAPAPESTLPAPVPPPAPQIVIEPPAAPSQPAADLQPLPEPSHTDPVPVVKQPDVPPPPPLPIETIEFLLRRGREMLALQDMSAARLLFRRAAEGGSAEAMFELGQTYDPAVRTGFDSAAQSDRKEALRWYERAAAQGNEAAAKLLPRN